MRDPGENPFELGSYRVVLGSCTQELQINTNSGRRTPARATNPVREKEVIS
jgi:hypothetical protein